MRGSTCMYSHQVAPTCDSVFNGTRCSRTRRIVGDKNRCLRSHDYKVRLFMGAMRVPHELGFYGVRHAHTHINTTLPTKLESAADWMNSDVEAHDSEHDEAMADIEAEERAVDDGGRVQDLEDDNRSGSDLILFS
jgi:hypothetical protein